jgi:hypothetical protein
MKYLLIMVILTGCFAQSKDPVHVYMPVTLEHIEKIELGYLLYWTTGLFRHDPVFCPDTTGHGFKIGMRDYIPMKR